MHLSRFYPSLLALLAMLPAGAATDTVVLLHTNDIHDHIRIDYDGAGGLPYVAGYVEAQRAARPDVLLLDGGDVMEKGDMVAYATKSTVLYEAMARIGYDAITPGNHDFAFGVDHLKHCAELAPNTKFLAVNAPETGFPASAMFNVDGVRVGVIGVGRETEPNADTYQQIGEIAENLDKTAHLVVVVAHARTKECLEMAKAAPAVDVFVGGHSHEVLQKPVESEDTGAIIVQAGNYAEYVGRVEIEVDLDTEEKRVVDAGLAVMDHATTPCDTALAEYISKRESEACPQALEPVGVLEAPMGRGDIGRFAARALRHAAQADIGFCHAGKLLRSTLPSGAIDANAVYRTGGERGREVVEVSLTGAQILTYMETLPKTDWGPTCWDGFRFEPGAPSPKTDLVPAKAYRVALPAMEYEERLAKALAQAPGDGKPVAGPTRVNTTFTDAFCTLWREQPPNAMEK